MLFRTLICVLFVGTAAGGRLFVSRSISFQRSLRDSFRQLRKQKSEPDTKVHGGGKGKKADEHHGSEPTLEKGETSQSHDDIKTETKEPADVVNSSEPKSDSNTNEVNDTEQKTMNGEAESKAETKEVTIETKELEKNEAEEKLNKPENMESEKIVNKDDKDEVKEISEKIDSSETAIVKM